MAMIEFERLNDDDDASAQVEFRASNDSYSCEQDFWVVPGALADFGAELQSFPRDLNHTVRFEYGENPEFYCHLLLTTEILDSVGHSALAVTVANRLSPPRQSRAHFYIPCEAASINDFGRRLESWAKGMARPFRFVW